MKGSDIEFIVEDNANKHEDQSEDDNLMDSPNYNQPHTIVHESDSPDNTNVQNKCSSKEKENIEKEIHCIKSSNHIITQIDQNRSLG